MTEQSSTPQRPVFLTVLCILSFIASGLAILGYITAIGLAGLATAVSSKAASTAAQYGGTYSAPSTAIIWAYIIVGSIATVVGLIGVIKMWKLKKAGFMLYVAATVIALIMSIVYTGVSANLIGIVISAAFIVMYGLNLKSMS